MLRRAAVCVLVICAAACVWRSYATILAVHLDVLTQTAAKLCAVVEDKRGPTAEGMAEYVYPAKRAREFLRQFSNYSERASYQKLGAFLDRYEAMVRGVDAARTQDGALQAELPRLTASRDALLQLAAEIRAELKQGR